MHTYVCGHAQYLDFKISFERICLWSDEAVKYIFHLSKEYRACRATSQPYPSRKVSISLLKTSFKIVLPIDNLYLYKIYLLNAMDYATNFLALYIVE